MSDGTLLSYLSYLYHLLQTVDFHNKLYSYAVEIKQYRYCIATNEKKSARTFLTFLIKSRLIDTDNGHNVCYS